jgi:hypothetical protein
MAATRDRVRAFRERYRGRIADLGAEGALVPRRRLRGAAHDDVRRDLRRGHSSVTVTATIKEV